MHLEIPLPLRRGLYRGVSNMVHKQKKNRRSWIVDIKSLFPQITKKTCSYTRKTGESIIVKGQVKVPYCKSHLSYSRQTTLTNWRTCMSILQKTEWQNHEYQIRIQVLLGSRKTFRPWITKNNFPNAYFTEYKIC